MKKAEISWKNSEISRKTWDFTKKPEILRKTWNFEKKSNISIKNRKLDKKPDISTKKSEISKKKPDISEKDWQDLRNLQDLRSLGIFICEDFNFLFEQRLKTEFQVENLFRLGRFDWVRRFLSWLVKRIFWRKNRKCHEKIR